MINFAELMKTLPTPDTQDFTSQIQSAKSAKVDAIIVLDDDPTGTQTVYDVPVLTSWDRQAIEAELERAIPLFYILTNSRSLTEPEAIAMGELIGRNIKAASESTSKKCLVVSRGDSTLRGHYPAEVDALENGLGIDNSVHMIVPAFFEGGRYTIDDVHYVREGEQLIPAADTPFAQDKVFGYQHSNLLDWVVEKTRGSKPCDLLKSLSLQSIREQSSDDLTKAINGLGGNSVCVVNACEQADLDKVALSILQSDQPMILRSAASIVASLDAKPKKPLLSAQDLNIESQRGGLIVVGSYVPKTTAQLTHFMANTDIHTVEIDVEKLLSGGVYDSQTLAIDIDQRLINGESVVLYSSRKLISSGSDQQNLSISNTVSNFLTNTVKSLSERPAYIIAKGGITSSDTATKSLAIKRAMVQGQILPGIPVWQAEVGSKFPELPYIVFPGNVGADDALTIVYNKLAAE